MERIPGRALCDRLARLPDHLARRRDAGQRAAAHRLEHRRGGRRRHGHPDPYLLATRPALHRARANRRSRKMSLATGKPELMTTDLGWPEGPTVQPDGSLVF